MIQFLHPAFLWGLLFLAVPILLHLFSFKKYKKVYFSNFRFLESLQQEKKNSSRLKNLLLLLLRLSVIAAVVIVFAGPYLPGSPVPGSDDTGSGQLRERILLYVDNSYSMSNTGSKGSLLEEAKKQAFDMLSAYPAGTLFSLISNDEQAAVNLNREECQTLLGDIRLTARSKMLSEVFREAREMAGEQKATLFLLSDFQQYGCDFQQITGDSLTAPVFFLLEAENRNNLYIKEVSFEQAFHRKERNDLAQVTLGSSSANETTNLPITLTVNGKVKGLQQANLPATGESVLEIGYLNTESGFCKGIAELNDLPVVFDNRFYFSYRIDDQINVLCIDREKRLPYFGKLFSDTAAYRMEYTHIDQTANIRFSDYQLVILDRINTLWTGLESTLENYVREGGNLLVLPGAANGLNGFLEKLHAPRFGTADTNAVITYIERQSALFKEVFESEENNVTLPGAKCYYPLHSPGNGEKLLAGRKGEALLTGTLLGKGTVYVSAFDFNTENSDLVFHPLFVPLMINMASNANSGLNPSWTLHSRTPLLLNRKEIPDNSRLRIVSQEHNLEFIAETRQDASGNLVLVNAHNIRQAGLYDVLADDRLVDVLACNYNRAESELRYCDADELRKQFPDARVEKIETGSFERNSQIIKEVVLEDTNRYLARWFLWLAVIALLAEQFVWRKKLN
jgi:hypothetical protein